MIIRIIESEARFIKVGTRPPTGIYGARGMSPPAICEAAIVETLRPAGGRAGRQRGRFGVTSMAAEKDFRGRDG